MFVWLSIGCSRLSVGGDGGDAEDIVGANPLCRQRKGEVEALAVPVHFGLAVALQDVAALAEIEEDLVEDDVEALVFVDIDVVFGLSADGVEVHLILGHGVLLVLVLRCRIDVRRCDLPEGWRQIGDRPAAPCALAIQIIPTGTALQAAAATAGAKVGLIAGSHADLAAALVG